MVTSRCKLHIATSLFHYEEGWINTSPFHSIEALLLRGIKLMVPHNI